MVFASIRHGILLGLGAAAPIGPVNVEIARRALRSGFWGGALIGFGAVTVDVAYAVLSTLSFRWLLNVQWVVVALGFAGGALLGFLGAMSLLAARKQWGKDPITEKTRAPDPPPRQGRRRAYITGLLMTLSNPLTLSFWFLGVPSTAAQSATSLPYVCLGVFAGTVAWVISFSGAMSLLSRARRWLLPLADLAGGLTLLWFAVGAIWRALRLVL